MREFAEGRAMTRIVLASLAVALAAAAARADEVQLANGKKITNAMVSKPSADKVVVEVGAGTITLSAKEVSSINPGPTPLHEYAAKERAALASNKAADLWDLAQWAKQNKLSRYVGPLSEKVIAIDPNHEGARRELRHEKVGGKWLTYEQAQEAKGLKQVDGRWMTTAEVELRERKRIEAEERALAARREREERAEDERRRRQQAIDDYNAMMQRQLSQLDGYFYQPSAFWPPYFRPYPWASYLRSRRYYQDGWMYGSGGGIGTFDLFRFIPDPFLKKK
jgi:hypothetical protein